MYKYNWHRSTRLCQGWDIIYSYPTSSHLTCVSVFQVVKPLAAIGSSPSSSSSSPSSPSSHVPSAASAHTQTRSGIYTATSISIYIYIYIKATLSTHSVFHPVAMAIPTTTPWLANELGEPVCSMMTPPPYSYDPNGNDLPRGQRSLTLTRNIAKSRLTSHVNHCDRVSVYAQTAEFFSITSTWVSR